MTGRCAAGSIFAREMLSAGRRASARCCARRRSSTAAVLPPSRWKPTAAKRFASAKSSAGFSITKKRVIESNEDQLQLAERAGPDHLEAARAGRAPDDGGARRRID